MYLGAKKCILQKIKNGKIICISELEDIPKEAVVSAPYFECPSCGTELRIKSGTSVRKHFFHFNRSDEAVCNESALHLWMKESISNIASLPLTTVSLSNILGFEKVRGFFPEEKIYSIKSAEVISSKVEQKIGPYYVDVALETSLGLVAVEVNVTHSVDKKKRDFFKERDISCLEVSFNKEEEPTPELLQEALYRAKWISLSKTLLTKGTDGNICDFYEKQLDRASRLHLDGSIKLPKDNDFLVAEVSKRLDFYVERDLIEKYISKKYMDYDSSLKIKLFNKDEAAIVVDWCGKNVNITLANKLSDRSVLLAEEGTAIWLKNKKLSEISASICTKLNEEISEIVRCILNKEHSTVSYSEAVRKKILGFAKEIGPNTLPKIQFIDGNVSSFVNANDRDWQIVALYYGSKGRKISDIRDRIIKIFGIKEHVMIRDYERSYEVLINYAEKRSIPLSSIESEIEMLLSLNESVGSLNHRSK